MGPCPALRHPVVVVARMWGPGTRDRPSPTSAAVEVTAWAAGLRGLSDGKAHTRRSPNSDRRPHGSGGQAAGLQDGVGKRGDRAPGFVFWTLRRHCHACSC